MNHFFIVGNWKMYGTGADANIIATGIRNNLEHLEEVDAVLCPPAIWLTEVTQIIHSEIDHLHLGIQNVFDQEEGAFTGEISASMASNVAEYAIVGHSERVDLFREGPEFINSKVHSVLNAGMTPIVCVGEREKNDKTQDKLIEKLSKLLLGLSKEQIGKILIAYEPIWAVGTDKPDDPDHVGQIAEIFKKAFHPDLRVIYGGSINEENCEGFLHQKDISGLLVGRSSLKIKSFVTICRKAEEIAKTSF